MAGDAFDILGFKPTFELQSGELERAYLAKSARLHPDLAAGDAEAARAMALVNVARRTLQDPERRANAMLARLGGPSKEEDKSLPEGFLARMMDTREQIESSARSAADRAQWEAWAQEQRREAIADVAALFAGCGPAPSPEQLRAVRVRLNAWRYVERLIEQLDPDYDPRRADFDR